MELKLRPFKFGVLCGFSRQSEVNICHNAHTMIVNRSTVVLLLSISLVYSGMYYTALFTKIEYPLSQTVKDWVKKSVGCDIVKSQVQIL